MSTFRAPTRKRLCDFAIFEQSSKKFPFISARVLGAVVANDIKHPKDLCICHSFGRKVQLNGGGTGTRTWGINSILIFWNVFFSSGLCFTNLSVVWQLVGNLDFWNSREACRTRAFFPWAATEIDFKNIVQNARLLSFLPFFNHLLRSGSLNHASWKRLLYLAFLLSF